MVVTVLVFVPLASAFLLSANAARRTDRLSALVSGPLVVPSFAWVGLVVGNLVVSQAEPIPVVVYAVIGPTFVGLGYRLGDPGAATDSVARETETTPE